MKYESPAEKGLNKKIDYWKEKDNGMDFRILVAQAANLAQADWSAIATYDQDFELDKRFEFWFDFILRKRTDPKLTRKFEEYLWAKNNKEAVERDRKDEMLNDAEHDANFEHSGETSTDD